MIIAQTPLRLSFFGGGTDFPSYYASPANAHGGAVVGVSIDKYIYVIVKERFDERIYVNYSQKEIVDSVEQVQHELVREAMRLTGVTKGVEITTLADVPSEGSGLGSSSAVTVGLLQALWTHKGESRTTDQLAAEACRVELEVLGRPMGVQDAYFSALGGVRKFVFGPDDPFRVHWRRLEIHQERISQLGTTCCSSTPTARASPRPSSAPSCRTSPTGCPSSTRCASWPTRGRAVSRWASSTASGACCTTAGCSRRRWRTGSRTRGSTTSTRRRARPARSAAKSPAPAAGASCCST